MDIYIIRNLPESFFDDKIEDDLEAIFRAVARDQASPKIDPLNRVRCYASSAEQALFDDSPNLEAAKAYLTAALDSINELLETED